MLILVEADLVYIGVPTQPRPCLKQLKEEKKRKNKNVCDSGSVWKQLPLFLHQFGRADDSLLSLLLIGSDLYPQESSS